MSCKYKLTSSCVMSKVVHVLKHKYLPQMFRTLLFPFVHSSIIPTSFSSVLARFSLPLDLECYLRVWWTAKFWSSTITVSGLLIKVGICLIWDNEDPLAINLDQLISAVQIDSCINCIWHWELCISWLLYCFCLVPLWTHQLVYDLCSVRQQWLPFQGIQGSILWDLFLAHAVEDTSLDFGMRMNKHMLDYEGQISSRCMDVCLM